jgi:hypothetical protein
MARISEVLGFFAGLILVVGGLIFVSVGGETDPDLDPVHLVD